MKNIIHEIAQNLQCGMDSYYNPKTQEVISIPNISNVYGDEDEQEDAFGEDIKKVEEGCIKIEVLESHESFEIMEVFAEQLDDPDLQKELQDALNNRKPFQNFKHLVDHSPFRQAWFDFRQQALEKKVEDILKEHQA